MLVLVLVLVLVVFAAISAEARPREDVWGAGEGSRGRPHHMGAMVGVRSDDGGNGRLCSPDCEWR